MAEDVRELVERLDVLLERLERATGPVAGMAVQAVRALAEVYGAALAHVLAVADGEVIASLVRDELVCHLLALHGIHPDPAEERIRRALRELHSGGDVIELTGVREGVAYVRWAGERACAASAIADAVLTAAPELRGVETVTTPGPSPVIPVESLLRRPAGSRGGTP